MTPQQIEAMKQALEALKNNKLTHLYCEDTWYSCPKHEDGCANEAEGDECNCGADDVNAQFDQAITALEKALARPDQEPVAIKHMKEWVDLTDEQMCECNMVGDFMVDRETAKLNVQAKLKQKNGYAEEKNT